MFGFKTFFNSHIKKKLSLLVLVLFILSLNFGCTLNFKQIDTSGTKFGEEAEKAIREDSDLKQFDDTCKEFPVMGGFKLDAKKVLTKKNKNVIYFYTSLDDSKVNFPDLREFYTNYLKEKGWKSIAVGGEYVEFKKDDKYIMLETASGKAWGYGKVYSISCKAHSYSMVE